MNNFRPELIPAELPVTLADNQVVKLMSSGLQGTIIKGDDEWWFKCNGAVKPNRVLSGPYEDTDFIPMVARFVEITEKDPVIIVLGPQHNYAEFFAMLKDSYDAFESEPTIDITDIQARVLNYTGTDFALDALKERMPQLFVNDNHKTTLDKLPPEATKFINDFVDAYEIGLTVGTLRNL